MQVQRVAAVFLFLICAHTDQIKLFSSHLHTVFSRTVMMT